MKNLDKAIDKISTLVEKEIKRHGKKTGRIKRNDGSYKRGRLDGSSRHSKSVRTAVRGTDIAVTGSSVADFIDKGVSGTKYKAKGSPYSRKSAPPTRDIEKWMRSRGMKGSAYPIAQKIKERGTAPTGFITDAVESVIDSKEFDNLLFDGVSDDIDELLDLE